jgi:Fusaric acid resistance protein-like
MKLPAALRDGPRVRHAARVALGGAAVAALGSVQVGQACLSFIIFYVATIAGTPEPYQGYMFRSIAQTLVGSTMACVAVTGVLYIASISRVGAFFAALPIIVFFSALRVHRTLNPLGIIANVFFGFLLIARVRLARNTILPGMRDFAVDTLVAVGVAIAVNLVVPDRATIVGRQILAAELRRAGSATSTVATSLFGVLTSRTATPPLPAALKLSASTSSRSHRPSVSILSSPAAPVKLHIDPATYVEVSSEWERVMPLGRAGIESYSCLARARQLIAVSDYEPFTFGVRSSLFYHTDVSSMNRMLDTIRVLVTKTSSLESVAFVQKGNHVVSHFSSDNLVRFLGHAYIPLWVTHLSGIAAACTVASDYVDPAVRSSSIGTCPPKLHPDVDARSRAWSARRGFMYQGFLSRYRQRYLVKDKAAVGAQAAHTNPTSRAPSIHASCDQQAPFPSVVSGTSVHPMSRSMSQLPTLFKGPATANPFPGAQASTKEALADAHLPGRLSSGGARSHPIPTPGQIKGTEMQALIFLGVSVHALSEALASVQAGMDALCDHRFHIFEPIRWLWAPLKPLFQRIRSLLRGDIAQWEVSFIFTHTLMLSTIMGMALFFGPLQRFEASQVAWVYTSAGLAAQLSVEPTLFIGTLRVLATVSGSFTAYGASRALRGASPTAHVYGLPVLMATVTFVSLLAFRPSYRYAAFLVCLTTGVVSFCSRSTDLCRVQAIALLEESKCFPDVQFALTRSINVSIGVVLALVFHLLFWPRYAQTEARQKLSKAFINGSRLLSSLHRTYFHYAEPDGENVTVELSPGPGASVLQEHETIFENIRSQAVMGKCEELTQMAEDLVVRPVSDALLLINTDAKSLPTWMPGVFAIPPILLQLPEHFMALGVSLSEMASILGRRPILSGTYGRHAHLLYVDPMIFEYETMLVSLNNVVSISARHLGTGKCDAGYVEDLASAIRHLSLTLRVMDDRLTKLCEHSQAAWNTLGGGGVLDMAFQRGDLPGSNPIKHSRSLSCVADANGTAFAEATAKVEAAQPPHPDFELPFTLNYRGLSLDGSETVQSGKDLPRIDDIVLYNAFSFAAHACLSAFLATAKLVLADALVRHRRIETSISKSKDN